MTWRLPVAVAALLLGPVTGSARAEDRAAVEATVASAREAMMTDPAIALQEATKAEQHAGNIADPHARGVLKAKARWLRGEASVRLGQVGRAAPLINSALAAMTLLEPQSNIEGEMLVSRGTVRKEVDPAAALADYQAAHAIFARDADARHLAISLISIGDLYSDGKDYAAAKRYYRQALDAYHGDPQISLAIHHNIAANLSDAGQWAEADREYRAALALARDLRTPYLTARIYGNMARLELKRGELGQADRLIRAATTIAAGKDGDSLRPALLAVAAQAALQHGDRERAATLIDRSFAGQDPGAGGSDDRDAHQSAYEIYRAVGRDSDALVHLTALKRLEDKATQVAASINTALAAARFDYANQETRIATLQRDEARRTLDAARHDARVQQLIFLAAAGAAAIIVALLGFALRTSRRSRDKVRAANDDLAVTNAALGKALAAKTEFLATTSHEIRTPLNGILGMTQVMLADPALPAPTRDRMGVVHGAGLTMRALVDDILDVAKMETGNLTLEHAPFDLCATVTEASRLWEEQARGRGLAFHRDLGACPAMVEGDAARVRQIVFNLLSNALKFTAQGSVSLDVSVEGATYRIRVRDTGIGIAPDKLEQIFESFRQADAGTTRQFGGTGLGLSICRTLARAMGGDVAVASKPGEGSTFTVTLPLALAAGQEKSAADAGETAVLVVDRNPISRQMLKALVEPRAPVEVAGDLDAALALIGTRSLSRLLVDDAVVGGDPALRERLLAATREGGLAVTWLLPASAAADAVGLVAQGASRVVVKPVTGQALIAAMFDVPARPEHPLVSEAA